MISGDGLRIGSNQGDYVVRSVESARELVAAIGPDSNTFLLIDERLRSLYPGLVGAFDEGLTTSIVASEDAKSLDSVGVVCAFLQDRGAGRASRLVVVGGGILQDVGTFCAHVYHRGLTFDYVPTTLLSMADSCIGAKCAINLGSFKNQLGFFQAPRTVLRWNGFLETLSHDDVRSGFGEILKLAVIGGRGAYSRFEDHLDRYGFDVARSSPMIDLALNVKKPIIEVDEYDKGLRKTLNYGHTFGHALESASENRIPHGLAVAWGVDLANYVAWKTGAWSERDFTRVHQTIVRHFAFAADEAQDSTAVVRSMRADKKATSSHVTLILPDANWQLRLVETALDEELRELIGSYMELRGRES